MTTPARTASAPRYASLADYGAYGQHGARPRAARLSTA
jgi:hypothetical protein